MKLLLPILLCISLLSSCTGNTGKTPVVSPSTPTETRTIATPTYGTGKTQITLFADFQCPACMATNETIGKILEGYAASGKLTITYRQYPLSMHKNAK